MKRGAVFIYATASNACRRFPGRNDPTETSAISTSDSPRPAGRENGQSMNPMSGRPHIVPVTVQTVVERLRTQTNRGLLRNRQTARGSSAIRSMNRSKCSRRLSFSPKDNFFFKTTALAVDGTGAGCQNLRDLRGRQTDDNHAAKTNVVDRQLWINLRKAHRQIVVNVKDLVWRGNVIRKISGINYTDIMSISFQYCSRKYLSWKMSAY